MDARKAADLLCRSYASLSLSTAAQRTALSSSRAPTRRVIRASQCQSRRCLNTQAPRAQPSAATPRKPVNEADYNQDIYKSRDTFLPSRNSSTSEPRSTPSTFTGTPARTRMISKASPDTTTGKSSVDDLIASARAATRTKDAVRTSTWGAPTQRTTSRYDISNMIMPDSAASLAPVSKPRVVQELDIHVKPRTGRTVKVNPSTPNDLGTKLRVLDMLVARNKIRQEHARQKFHERPGLKRKRLASVRWRSNFKQRFMGVVGRVNDLRAQGW